MANAPHAYYKQNRLKQLRAFCYAARAGSISKAAEQLYLSQPSVSLQIQALERELSTTLFERHGPSIRLTPEGKSLKKLALPLVEGMDALPELFAAQCGNMDSGNLDIAAGESTILYLLPETTRQFTRDYPKIELKLHNVTGRDGLGMLRADDVDFAVGPMLEVPEDLSYHPIFTYHPVLITPVDHPLARKKNVTLEDISPYPLILPPRHLSTWGIVELVFQQHQVNYHVSLETGGGEVIKKYVELGLGVSIVTDICMMESDTLVQIPLKKYFPDRSYGIVLRKGKFLSAAAKKYIEMLDPKFFTRHPAIDNQ